MIAAPPPGGVDERGLRLGLSFSSSRTPTAAPSSSGSVVVELMGDFPGEPESPVVDEATALVLLAVTVMTVCSTVVTSSFDGLAGEDEEDTTDSDSSPAAEEVAVWVEEWAADALRDLFTAPPPILITMRLLFESSRLTPPAPCEMGGVMGIWWGWTLPPEPPNMVAISSSSSSPLVRRRLGAGWKRSTPDFRCGLFPPPDDPPLPLPLRNQLALGVPPPLPFSSSSSPSSPSPP
jgi:hypothetical protein